MVSVVVAYCKETGVIGKNGKIPWHLPEDIQHFKRLTENQIVLMGKTTWNSLPYKFRPLPNRINVVLTRKPAELAEGHKRGRLVFGDLFEALEVFKDNNLFIIGGGEIYKSAIEADIVDEIWASEIHRSYEGNTYFPRLNEGWKGGVVERYKDFDLVLYKR